MISRRQKMVNLWKQVRFIEIVDPGNQFVKNLMFDGVYSSDFALLSEDILDWFSAIIFRYRASSGCKGDHRSNVCLIETVRIKQRRSFRIAFVFQYIVSENRFKKDIRPAQTLSPRPSLYLQEPCGMVRTQKDGQDTSGAFFP